MGLCRVLVVTFFGVLTYAASAPLLLRTLADPELVDLVFVDDGRRVLVASGEGLEMWDVEEGQRIALRSLRNIQAVASNAARTLVAVGLDYGLRVFELPSLAPIQFLSHPKVAGPNKVALSPSGRVVAGDFGMGIVVWRTYTGEPVVFAYYEDIAKDLFTVDTIAFLSEEELVIAGALRVFVWEFLSGRMRELAQTKMRFYHLLVDSQQRLVGFPVDSHFVLVRGDTGEVVARVPFHGGSYFWAGLTPKGELILPGYLPGKGEGLLLFPRGADKPACCYECCPGCLQSLEQWKASLSRDGSRLAVVEAPDPFVQRVVVYDVGKCQRVGRFGRWGFPTVAVGVVSRWIVRATPKGLEVWDVQTGQRYRTLALPALRTAAVASNAPVVAAATAYGSQAVVWNWETNYQVALGFDDNRALRLALTPDGTRLAVVHWGGDVSLWSVEERKEILRLREENPHGFPVIAQGGELFLTVGRKGVRIRDLATGTLLDEYPAEMHVSEVHLVREGLLLIRGLMGRTWAGKPLTWHRVSFSPKGKVLELVSLKAPHGLGAVLHDGRTLVIWESDPYRTDHQRTELWLWNVEKDEPIYRWTLELAPALYRIPGGHVAALPGARQVLVGTAGSALHHYSVNLPPTNLAIRAPTWAVVNAPLEICASAEDPEGGNLTFLWDLGEGVLAEGTCVKRVFPAEGAYIVKVIARDDAGAIVTAEHQIRVTSLLAEATFWPARPGVLEEVVFQDASVPSDKVLRVVWDFGDGTGAEGRVVRHRYSAPGQYLVRAEVHFVTGVTLRAVLRVEVEDVSCIKNVPAPGAAQFYLVHLAMADRNRLRFGDSVWIVRRAQDGEQWILIARAVVFVPQADGVWVVLAESLSGALPKIGDRVLLHKP